MANKRLLVCDLDNTLYDWVSYFVISFYAMIDVVVEITGCSRENILDDIRSVHRKYGDSEQPFALLEAETIRKIYPGVPGETVARALDPAFHAFNSARVKSLKLHPQVRETLDLLEVSQIKLVALTESRLYPVIDRLRRLGLIRYFSKIYCRERSASVHPMYEHGTKWFDGFPMHRVVELSHHQRKPNPEVLLEICSNEGVSTEGAAYVGDSVARDMMMAKRAGVYAIWAAYGDTHDATQYDALVRVSHWTPEEITREQRLREEARSISPDYIASSSFAEVVTALGVGPSESISPAAH